jgi:putative serine protease PepD
MYAAPAWAGQTLASTPEAACQESLPALYRRVSPAVVLIRATSIDPYDPEHRVRRVEGSGVIIDSSGLILTNSHVVYGRALMAVTLDDGTMVPAQLVGADPLFDVALIRIPEPDTGTLPVASLGDSDHVLVGDEVYAIGNPMGLDQTLTRGIVSAVNRVLPGAAWSLSEPLIQTDAAINPGNSGGSLVDRCGDIIGITTAVMPDGQSLGFAVPVNLIREVIPGLIADGRLIRPWLGIQGQFVPSHLKELLRIPLTEGFLVESVDPGSPAQKAGVQDGEFELTVAGEPILLGGDIVTALNGITLDDSDALPSAMASLKIGTTAEVTVFRDGAETRIDIPIVERPILPGDLPGHGSDAAPMTDAARTSRTPTHKLATRQRAAF